MIIIKILLFVTLYSIYLTKRKDFVQAETCSNSSATLCVVRRCPKNQSEWERAAKRKNCQSIWGIEGCKKVEYHCLVNEHRNETIEICLTRRFLQGYCPVYRNIPNEPRNDYNRPCMNFKSPLNCSSQYSSTEAYKWQICYEYVYNKTSNDTSNDNDKFCQGEKLRETSYKSPESSNGFALLYVLVAIALVLVLPVIIYFICVFYHWKHHGEKPIQALCFFRRFICKTSDRKQKGNTEEKRRMIDTPFATPDGDNRGTFGIQYENNRETLDPQNGDNRETPGPQNGDNRETSSPQNGDNKETPGPQNKDNRETLDISKGDSVGTFDKPDENSPRTETNAPVKHPSDSGSPENREANEPKLTLDARVANLKLELDRLKGRLVKVIGDDITDLEFKVTSIEEKIRSYFEKSFQRCNIKTQLKALEDIVSNLEFDISNHHKTLDDLQMDTIDPRLTFDKPVEAEQKAINNSIQCASKGKEEQTPEKLLATDSIKEKYATLDNDDEEDKDALKGDGEHREVKGPFRRPTDDVYMNTKRRDVRIIENDTCGTSSFGKKCQFDAEKGCPEKQSIKEKTKHLEQEARAIIMDFETYKSNENLKHLKLVQVKVSEIKIDLKWISKIYGLEETDNTSNNCQRLSIKEIERKLNDTKDYFHEKKCT